MKETSLQSQILVQKDQKEKEKKNNNERDTERKKKNIFCFVLFFLTAEVCTF